MSDPHHLDVTAAQRLVERLIESIDVLGFLDQMPDVVVVADLEGRILHITRSTHRVSIDELRGVLMWTTVREEDQSKLRGAMREAAESGKAQRIEGVSAYSDSVFEGTITPLYDAEQRVVGFINVARDVTALRAAEQVLNDRIASEQRINEELRRVDELRAEFVAKVAHDLRTPITTVYGFAQTLLQRWSTLSDDDRLSMLRLIASGADRLNQLVIDTLDVSRIEAAEFRAEIAPFDIVDASRELCEELNGLPPRGRVDLDVRGELPLVLGDVNAWGRILTNLVGNALKYSAPDTNVQVTIERDGNDAKVSITDHGVGIASEDLPRLFRKFSQVGESRNTSTGTGLGLYICKALVDAQGGTIDVTSSPHDGTTMTVRLPLADT